MRSISSSGATCSASRRSASRPKGRLQRLTRNPGPSAASITTLPIASPVARAVASASAPDCSPATTSSSFMTGAGLKKCMPTTRSGRRGGRGDRGDEQRRGVGGQHAVRADDLREAGEQLPLELEGLRRSLDHELTCAEILQHADGLEPRGGRGRLLGCQPPARGAALERRADRAQPALQCIGRRVVQQRARAGLTGQLGDSGSHRAGAEHADRPRGGRLSVAHPGTSALMPVIARPMISFWICEVPS